MLQVLDKYLLNEWVPEQTHYLIWSSQQPIWQMKNTSHPGSYPQLHGREKTKLVPEPRPQALFHSTHGTFLCWPVIFIPSGFPPTFSPRGNDIATGRIPRGLGAGSEGSGSCRECVSGFWVGQKGIGTSRMKAHKNVSMRLVHRQCQSQERKRSSAHQELGCGTAGLSPGVVWGQTMGFCVRDPF